MTEIPRRQQSHSVKSAVLGSDANINSKSSSAGVTAHNKSRLDSVLSIEKRTQNSSLGDYAGGMGRTPRSATYQSYLVTARKERLAWIDSLPAEDCPRKRGADGAVDLDYESSDSSG